MARKDQTISASKSAACSGDAAKLRHRSAKKHLPTERKERIDGRPIALKSCAGLQADLDAVCGRKWTRRSSTQCVVRLKQEGRHEPQLVSALPQGPSEFEARNVGKRTRPRSKVKRRWPASVGIAVIPGRRSGQRLGTRQAVTILRPNFMKAPHAKYDLRT